jgi:hypothetical protein
LYSQSNHQVRELYCLLVACVNLVFVPWINSGITTMIVTIVVLGVMHNVFRDDHESNTCSCIGDTLTFQCTVMSGLRTIWRGSAFNCPSSGNEISLLNSYIDDGTCNNEMIVGRVIRREETNYTSQLNVTLSSDLIGEIIECASDSTWITDYGNF